MMPNPHKCLLVSALTCSALQGPSSSWQVSNIRNGAVLQLPAAEQDVVGGMHITDRSAPGGCVGGCIERSSHSRLDNALVPTGLGCASMRAYAYEPKHRCEFVLNFSPNLLNRLAAAEASGTSSCSLQLRLPARSLASRDGQEAYMGPHIK